MPCNVNHRFLASLLDRQIDDERMCQASVTLNESVTLHGNALVAASDLNIYQETKQ